MKPNAKRQHDAKMAAVRQGGHGAADKPVPQDVPGGLARVAAKERKPRLTVAERLLQDEGFTTIQPLHDGGFDTLPYKGWFRATGPDGSDVLLLRQGPSTWHAFYKDNGGGSGATPKQALNGHLGDVIDTDRQLHRYCDLLIEAPDDLLQEFDGLYYASVEAFNERGLQP